MTLDLTINNSLFSNDSVVSCDSYNWNGNVYTTSGIYVDTLTTISGCDSVVTLDLTINNSLYSMIVRFHVIVTIGMEMYIQQVEYM